MGFLLTVIGLGLLLLGAELLLRASLSLANRFRLSPTFSGLSLLALGTSLPELMISSLAVSKSSYDIAFGNIFGSNIFNILLIGGICFLIRFHHLSRYVYESLFLLGSLALFIVFIMDNLLSIGESFALFIFIFLFLWFIAKTQKTKGQEGATETSSLSRLSLSVPAFFVASCMLFFGAKLSIQGVTELGEYFSWSQRVSSSIILAAGTGLPEVVTSVLATLKRHTGMAIGNILGSNIFNTSATLSFASLITWQSLPLTDTSFIEDLKWMTLITFIFVATLYLVKTRKSAVPVGILFLLGYGAFLYRLIAV